MGVVQNSKGLVQNFKGLVQNYFFLKLFVSYSTSFHEILLMTFLVLEETDNTASLINVLGHFFGRIFWALFLADIFLDTSFGPLGCFRANEENDDAAS